MVAGRKQQVSTGSVALVALLVVAAVARAGAFRVCNVQTSALETCRSYCENGSTESSPSQDCCDAARDADIECLCGHRDYLESHGIDVNRAMQIPSQCGLGGPANPCDD